MKRDFGLIFHLFLIFGDACAVLLSFLVAYFMRTHLDQRPFYFESNPVSFVLSLAWLIPVYLILLAAFGLYRKSIFLSRSRWSEYGRLLLVSVIGVMAIITYGFCFDLDFFPVRIMALYTIISNFLLLLLFRSAVRAVRHLLRPQGHSSA